MPSSTKMGDGDTGGKKDSPRVSVTYRDIASDYRAHYDLVSRFITDVEMKAKSWMAILVGLLSTGIVSGELIGGPERMTPYFQKVFYLLLLGMFLFAVPAFKNLLRVITVSSYELPPVLPLKHLSDSFSEDAYFRTSGERTALSTQRNSKKAKHASMALRRGVLLSQLTCSVFAALVFVVIMMGLEPGLVMGSLVVSLLTLALSCWAIASADDRCSSNNQASSS